MGELLKNNSEILFIYDAKLTNPNGDPDDENRPRMDYETKTNLVSDVRLKRYVRDYLQEKGYEIFVAKVEGETVNATERLEKLLGKSSKNIGKDDVPVLLEKLVDVRLFGATMPIKSEDGGSSLTFTGPVQFNWGCSLNKVELVESNTITSRFSSASGNEQGTMGKDYRLYYSLIAFHGIVAAHRAKFTQLDMETLSLLDEALVKAIPLLATRSKIGQYPRLYLRVEYVDDTTYLGDFRSFLEVNPEEGLRDITDYALEAGKLVDLLAENNPKITKILLYFDHNLKTTYHGEAKNFAQLLAEKLGDSKVSILNY